MLVKKWKVSEMATHGPDPVPRLHSSWQGNHKPWNPNIRDATKRHQTAACLTTAFGGAYLTNDHWMRQISSKILVLLYIYIYIYILLVRIFLSFGGGGGCLAIWHSHLKIDVRDVRGKYVHRRRAWHVLNMFNFIRPIFQQHVFLVFEFSTLLRQ